MHKWSIYCITPTVKLSIYNPNFLVTWSLNKNKTTYHVSSVVLISHSVSAYSASESLLPSTTAAGRKLFKGRSWTLLEIPDINPASQWIIATPKPNQDLAMPYQPAQQRKRSALGISTCSNVRWLLSAAWEQLFSALPVILSSETRQPLHRSALQNAQQDGLCWDRKRGRTCQRNYSFMILTAKYSRQKKKTPRTLREGSRRLLHYHLLYLPPNTP